MSETLNMPVMRGSAIHAMGAGTFEVPLFSHIIGNLWMGSSPSEFPDELEEWGYQVAGNDSYKAMQSIRGKPVNCRWLYAEKNSPEDIDVPRFDKILNLYKWGDYVVPSGTERITVTLYDGYDVDPTQIDSLVKIVTDWIDGDFEVLVHCQAGLNRSSLVVARVLMDYYGMTADEAIDFIREKRSPMCLCNDNFRRYLKGL